MEWNGPLRREPVRSAIFVEHVAFQHLFSGYRFPEHMHRTAELLICLSGSITIAAQNETITVRAGDYFLAGPHFMYSATVEGEEMCSLLQLYFTADLFLCGDVLPEERLQPEILTEPHPYLLRPCPKQLEACIRGIYEEYPGKRVGADEMLRHYLCQLELLLARELEQACTGEGRPVNPHLLRACSYIREHCCTHLTVAEIAGSCNISTRYLRKLFSEYLHTSVCEYLSDARIRKSIELLREDPDYPLARLALDVGFSSQQHFSAVFKEVMSIPPKRYLAQCKEEEAERQFRNL